MKPTIVLNEDRVVVVDKPAGMSSEDVARALGRKLVHRIDQPTSGLLILADDARTVTRLQRALRAGDVERTYRFVANGRMTPRVLTSELVRDRGDGLRGSGVGGKLSIAHVVECEAHDVVTDAAAPGVTRTVTLGVARLQTGRTHQLRIQLAELGHPIVGEHVYIRDAKRDATVTLVDAPRLMLHAERLRFTHPSTKRVVDVVSEPTELLAWLGMVNSAPRVRGRSPRSDVGGD